MSNVRSRNSQDSDFPTTTEQFQEQVLKDGRYRSIELGHAHETIKTTGYQPLSDAFESLAETLFLGDQVKDSSNNHGFHERHIIGISISRYLDQEDDMLNTTLNALAEKSDCYKSYSQLSDRLKTVVAQIDAYKMQQQLQAYKAQMSNE